jgi:hypothetical protein
MACMNPRRVSGKAGLGSRVFVGQGRVGQVRTGAKLCVCLVMVEKLHQSHGQSRLRPAHLPAKASL